MSVSKYLLIFFSRRKSLSYGTWHLTHDTATEGLLNTVSETSLNCIHKLPIYHHFHLHYPKPYSIVQGTTSSTGPEDSVIQPGQYSVWYHHFHNHHHQTKPYSSVPVSASSTGPTYLGLLYYMDQWALNVFYFLSLMWLMADGWWLCWLGADVALQL